MLNKIIRPFRRFYSSLKSLIIWFPIIWNDRDWDHWYIFALLFKKFKKMLHRYETVNMYVGQERVKRQLKYCVFLLDRIVNDKYDYENYGQVTIEYKGIPYYFADYYKQRDVERLCRMIMLYHKSWWD